METFSRGTLAGEPDGGLAPEYVTGLVEGAGSFTFSRSSKQLTLYFALKLPIEDRPLLEGLQAFFGVGRIYENGSSAYYRVTRHQDLPIVVRHFERVPLRSRKAAAFDLWKQMVDAKQSFRRPDREQLEQLARQLSSRR